MLCRACWKREAIADYPYCGTCDSYERPEPVWISKCCGAAPKGEPKEHGEELMPWNDEEPWAEGTCSECDNAARFWDQAFDRERNGECW